MDTDGNDPRIQPCFYRRHRQSLQPRPQPEKSPPKLIQFFEQLIVIYINMLRRWFKRDATLAPR